jgi:hypothetical protein
MRPKILALCIAAAVGCALPSMVLADAGGGSGVTVIKDIVEEVDVVTSLPGCDGSFVPMSFTGTNTYHVRIFPDGSTSIGLQSLETATWTEAGVTHVVPFTNHWTINGLDPATGGSRVFTITLHGHGLASDGTTTRMSLVGHTIIGSDGTPRVDFSKGQTVCGL